MTCTRHAYRTLIAAKMQLFRDQVLAGQRKRWRGLIHYCTRGCMAWHIYPKETR